GGGGGRRRGPEGGADQKAKGEGRGAGAGPRYPGGGGKGPPYGPEDVRRVKQAMPNVSEHRTGSARMAVARLITASGRRQTRGGCMTRKAMAAAEQAESWDLVRGHDHKQQAAARGAMCTPARSCAEQGGHV